MTMPFSGKVHLSQLELAMINKYTKFEAAMINHSKDTKGNQNVEIGSVWGHWEQTI